MNDSKQPMNRFTVIVSFTSLKEDAVFNYRAPSLAALFSHLANVTKDSHTPIHNVKSLTIVPKE